MSRDIEINADKEVIDSYKKAGAVASAALHYGARQIKDGKSMREMLDSVEEVYYIKKIAASHFPPKRLSTMSLHITAQQMLKI